MKKPEPEEIINAFDEILDYTFGRSRGRDYPAKEDLVYAKNWIENGITIPIASCVFAHRMASMHEHWLHQIDPNDKKNIPSTLKLFDENILSAIGRMERGGEPIKAWEQSESSWKARLYGFYKNGSWLPDMWGARPGDPYCRAPQRLIAEAQKKTA